VRERLSGLRRLLDHPLVSRISRPFLKLSPVFQLVLDALAWGAAATVGALFRSDFHLNTESRIQVLKFLPIAGAVQLTIGLAFGLYRRRWRYGSFDEVTAVVATTFAATIVLYLIDSNMEPQLVPRSAVIMGGCVGTISMLGIRFLWRLLLEVKRRPSDENSKRLIVFGVGDLGIQMTTTMLRSPNSPFLPVAFLDDDPARRRLSVLGVSVLGGRADLAEVAAKVDASALLIAISKPNSGLINDLSERAFDAGLDVKVVPPIEELIDGLPSLGDIRDLSEADLLGRHEIQTDVDSIAGYLDGKRVLVTGAGGSIGSELCRQINRFNTERLVMLDRDESALHAVQLSIHGRALLDTPDLVLADLRDPERIREVFEEVRPHVVFHAAALKHLPLLERYPHEALKSNVIGTQTVLEAAAAVGVERFVNISTDKAANPTSVLGYSKRVAERLTANMAATASGTFLSVRFGNVLGSRGSVLTSFRSQIESGGPVTVTDAEVTRYFMTVPEAVQLVVQAGAIGEDGEVLVLDMGDPVRINDVAERLIKQSRRPIEIVYTGLRPAEKLHEELLGDGELDRRPNHPLITQAAVPPLDASVLRDAPAGDVEDRVVIEWMADHCLPGLDVVGPDLRGTAPDQFDLLASDAGPVIGERR